MLDLLGYTPSAPYSAASPRFAENAAAAAGRTAAAFLPTLSDMQDSFRVHGGGARSVPMTTRPPWATTYYHSGRVNASARSLPGAMAEDDGDGVAGGGVGHSFRAQTLSGPARSSTFIRYTPNDWMASNLTNYMSSDRVRGSSERMRLDISRLCREADDRTMRTQEDVARRLGDRIGDIDYWKEELLNEKDNMRVEIEALANAKACLEKTLADTENPLFVAQECLFNREKRMGVDLVHDEVEKELTREVDNIKRCQEEMRGMIRSATNQLSLNRAAQHELDKDSCDKKMALNLDSTCQHLRKTSRGLQYHHGIEQVDRSNSVPLTWIKFTSENIARSQNERTASRELRSSLEQLLTRVSSAIMNQWNAANTAITDRSREYLDTRNKLQTHLAKVTQEIYDMERSTDQLKRCIEEKESPLQLAQTRLMTRTQRPNVERCRDQVHHRLVEEVYEIGETLEGLKAKLRESEHTLQNLVRTRTSLEQDLNVKNNSLFIDKETCLGMRKSLPMLPRLAIY